MKNTVLLLLHFQLLHNPHKDVPCHPFLVNAVCQQRFLLRIAQKSALDQDCRRGDVFHHEDLRVDVLLCLLIARIDSLIQRELHRIRDLGTPLFFAVKHLRAVRLLG